MRALHERALALLAIRPMGEPELQFYLGAPVGATLRELARHNRAELFYRSEFPGHRDIGLWRLPTDAAAGRLG